MITVTTKDIIGNDITIIAENSYAVISMQILLYRARDYSKERNLNALAKQTQEMINDLERGLKNEN